MNDPGYTKEVTTGDVHTANQKAASLSSRDQAKTFIYAFLYGAGPAKIASVAGRAPWEGKNLIEEFLKNTPTLAELKKKVAKEAGQGWLRGLDGRKLWVRSEHAALNTLLQGAGAIVMKKALVQLVEWLESMRIPYRMVCNIHDEWQIETDKEFGDMVGKYGVLAIEAVGQKLNCPLTGEYKIGQSWAETH
jgi:DNA polymerase I